MNYTEIRLGRLRKAYASVDSALEELKQARREVGNLLPRTIIAQAAALKRRLALEIETAEAQYAQETGNQLTIEDA